MAKVAVVGRRTCALLAVISAVLHGFSLGHAGNSVVLVSTVAMIAGCLSCARDLWLNGTTRAWVLVASMNLAMIAVHLPMSAAHRHGVVLAAAAPTHQSAVMALAMGLAVIEAVIATVVAYYRTGALPPRERP